MTWKISEQRGLGNCHDAINPLHVLNSHKRLRQNLPLQYQYNIKQASDENKELVHNGPKKPHLEIIIN